MTARLVLVRHGQPAGAWGRDADPGLDALGHAQAEAMAEQVTALFAGVPVPIVVSPLQRTRDTAAPLARRWGVEVDVEPAVGELCAPPDPVPDPRTWLAGVMASRYGELGPDLRAFRARVLERLLAIDRDTVVVTHFLAINVVVGAATDDDRVVTFAPAHCSRTVVDVTSGALRVVELGATAADAVHLG